MYIMYSYPDPPVQPICPYTVWPYTGDDNPYVYIRMSMKGTRTDRYRDLHKWALKLDTDRQGTLTRPRDISVGSAVRPMWV